MSGGRDQLHVPAVLPFPLLEQSISLPANRVVLEEAQPHHTTTHSLACQSKRSQIQQWELCSGAQILSFAKKNTKLNQLMLMISLKLVILLNYFPLWGWSGEIHVEESSMQQ